MDPSNRTLLKVMFVAADRADAAKLVERLMGTMQASKECLDMCKVYLYSAGGTEGR